MTGIHTSSINHDYYADKLLNSLWNGPKKNQLTILIRHWHAFERIVVSQHLTNENNEVRYSTTCHFQ